MEANILTIEAEPDPNLTKNKRRSLNRYQEAELVKKEREIGYILGMQAKFKKEDWKCLESCDINIHFYYSNRPIDYDGLAVMVAPIIDGLVDAGIMKDDNPNVIKYYRMRMEKVAKRSERRVVITVKEV